MLGLGQREMEITWVISIFFLVANLVRDVEVTWVISIFFWCKGYHDDVDGWADVSSLVEDAR